MKAFLITAGSFALTAGVLANAYLQKRQFYPSVVYITKSSPSLAVLYIQAFVFVILFGKLLRKIFFGQLRAAELEHLIERSWYAVTETCLAFTVFRDDFSPRFVVLFTLLLFLKSFHWLAEDRVDYMERSPLISLLFHSRVVSLLSCLALLDVYSINHAYYSTLMKGASVQLVFGFEYAILLTIVLHILVKYILHTVDLQNENPWENKAVFLLYAELLLGFVKVILYMLFLAIMIKVHTFPLFAIRPMYLAMRTFKKALNDVIMSRRAIRNMNTLYPDATPEELASGDNVCIICREDMTEGCKKLPCNHIFHMTCLRSWFQRQQTCPTCRMDVLRAAPPAPAPRPPPAQPPAAPAPQPPFGMFPGFGMWPQDQQAAPQQPPGSAPAASPAAAPSAPSSPGAPVSPPMSPAPMMMPPFFMPPTMPFSMPMPAPPTDLSGLSDAELAAMEGTERRHLEARVECLRQIQVLLDAAVTQMQQYTQAVSNLSAPPTMWQPAPGPNLLSSAAAAPTTPTPSILTPIPSATLSSSSSPSAALSPSGRKDATVGDITSSAPGAPADELEGAVGYTDPAAASMPTADESQDDSSINEVRRRRLERFSSSTTQDGQQETKADKLDLD